MLARLRTLLAALGRRGSWERELREELESHIRLRADDLVRQGLDPHAALRQARVELGSRDAYRDDARAVFGLRWLDEARQDVAYAARSLLRNPGFALVAIVSLALGVGANTVVFSVSNALLLRSFPVAAPEQLGFLQTSTGPSISFPTYRDLRDQNTTVVGLASYRFNHMALGNERETNRIWGYLATGNYFELLGVRPAMGRLLTAEDDRAPGASPVIVLAYATWQSRFAADPSVIGRSIRLNGLPFTIVGVAPPGFTGVEHVFRPEIWVPMMMQAQVEGWSWLEERGTNNAMVIARRKPGVSVQQAESDLNRILAGLAREFPGSNAGLSVRLVKPGLVGDTGRPATTAFLTGITLLAALVLLAACANLAGLLSSRTADRAREIAVRVSIGASRGRVLRQLTTETLVLSLGGGAAGWVVARSVLAALSGWQLTTGFPLQIPVEPDWTVFGFALAVSLVIGLGCGLVAARRAWQVDLNSTIKGDGQGFGSQRRWPVRELVLATQMALACVILTASAASIRGLGRALALPLGINPRGLALVAFDFSLSRRSEVEARALQRRVLEAVSTLPGTSRAAFANSLPLAADQSSTTVFADDEADFSATRGVQATYYDVSPGYFATVETRLLGGREFTWHDDASAPRVAIINEAFGRRLFGTENVVGRRFRYGKDEAPVEIVGVVEDGKYRALTEDPTPTVFRASAQSYNSATLVLARSSLAEPLMARRIRDAVAEIDPTLAVFSVGGADQLIGLAFIPSQLAAGALSGFGLLAIVLALTGIYGMSAYMVSRTVREIGVRTALGARPVQVLNFVFRRTALVLGAGSLAGLGASVLAGRVLANVVYQASAAEPMVLTAAALGMLAVGIAAAVVPARRALSIGPLRALRSD